MSRRPAFSVVAFAFLLGSTDAAGLDLSFKGVRVGGSLDEAKAAMPSLQCRPAVIARSPSHLECSPSCPTGVPSAEFLSCYRNLEASNTYALVPMRALPVIEVFDGVVEEVRVYFDSEYFRTIVKAIADRQNADPTIHEEPVQNNFGATFVNELALWSDGNGSIFAQKYAGKITYGALTIFLREKASRPAPTSAASRAKDM